MRLSLRGGKPGSALADELAFHPGRTRHDVEKEAAGSLREYLSKKSLSTVNAECARAPSVEGINIIVCRQDRQRILQRCMRDKYLSILGGRVRVRRERLSLSQTMLARKAGIHANVVGRLERGIYNPSVLKLLAIADALRVPLRKLL
jgi:DNA-binding XRE family transcriptional regulator